MVLYLAQPTTWISVFGSESEKMRVELRSERNGRWLKYERMRIAFGDQKVSYPASRNHPSNSGRYRPESVEGLDCNQWKESIVTGGRNALESVEGIARNTHQI